MFPRVLPLLLLLTITPLLCAQTTNIPSSIPTEPQVSEPAPEKNVKVPSLVDTYERDGEFSTTNANDLSEFDLADFESAERTNEGKPFFGIRDVLDILKKDQSPAERSSSDLHETKARAPVQSPGPRPDEPLTQSNLQTRGTLGLWMAIGFVLLVLAGGAFVAMLRVWTWAAH